MGSFYKPVNENQLVSATADKSVTAFWWRHTPSKGLANIDSASLWIWNHGGEVGEKHKGDGAGTQFDTLTRSEKLALIENYLKSVYLGIAQQQNAETLIEEAQRTAASQNSNYELTNGG